MKRHYLPMGRPARSAAGFTLIEALLAISVAAIGGSVLLLGTTSSLQTTSEAQERTIAEGMAQQMMDELMGNRYSEFGYNVYDTFLGPSTIENLTGNRTKYDDIDDFNGYESEAPTDTWGFTLGAGNGDGTQRDAAFMAPAGFFDHWRQEVEVYYVSEADLVTKLSVGQTSDYRAVVVRIIFNDPQRGERVLAERRGVVAYVPPM